MQIIGLGTATPARRYDQAECLAALDTSGLLSRLNGRSHALLRKVLSGTNGIRTRYLALEPLSEVADFNPDALQRRFERHAPALAAEAAEHALEDAGIAAGAIDAVIVSTCTGYLCPGLSSYLVERLCLSPDVLALDLVGHGCGAALPNLRTAAALIASGAALNALNVCVEVCSAAFYIDDDPGVLVSASLFGDGAAAAVTSREPSQDKRRIEWKAYGSMIDASRRDLLRFEHRGGMLRNVLTPPVPQLAAESSQAILEKVLGETSVPRTGITNWLWHAGGRDVLLALQDRLMLTAEDMSWSRAVLEEYGNLSSASVLFVLQAAVRGGAAPGHWWLSSFGAGFSAHGALLEAI